MAAPWTEVSLGVDLATEPKRTAVVVVAWDGAHGRIDAVEGDVDDDRIAAVASQAGAVGIDAPFGWPVEFLATVQAWTQGEPWPEPDGTPLEQRRRLAYRHTDRAVHELLGRWPLSVSTDRLGLVAMRAARCLTRIGEARQRVLDRSGADGVFEVWPAGALRRWGMHASRRSGTDGVELRARQLAALVGEAGLQVDPGHRDHLVASSHPLDALVCAVVARLAQLGRTVPPPPELLDDVRREGWIHLPRDRDFTVLDPMKA